MKKHWKSVEMVVRELLEVKALDGDEVTMIVDIADGKVGALPDLNTHRRVMEGHRIAS